MSKPIRALALLFALMAVPACLEPLQGTAETPDPPTPEAVTALLADGPWGQEVVTAALCNDSSTRWAFSTDGSVVRTSSRDMYDYDDNTCSTESSQTPGTYTLGDDASVTIALETEEVYTWQVAVLETLPTMGNPPCECTLLTTRAFVPAGEARFTTQGAQLTGFVSERLTAAIQFEATPTSGSQTVTVSATDTEATSADRGTQSWTFEAVIAPAGADWLAISREAAATWKRPEGVQNAAVRLREDLSRYPSPVLYYRPSDGALVSVPQSANWNSGWFRR